MKITIDSDICKRNNIFIDNILLLISIYFDCTITNDTLLDLKAEEYVREDESGNTIITPKGVELVETILTDSEYKKSIDRFETLAVSLRNLFPEGKKAGTSYMWRDSLNCIIKRLKLFMKKFEVTCSNEVIIKATEKYVEGFNKTGDYTYMQLLKYFIFKDDSSQLLAYIENLDAEDTEDKEWVNTLK